MRAIDADAFKDYIRGACEEMKHLYKDNGAWAKEITESFCKDIDEQPTVFAEPKRGKWEIKKSTIHPYGNDVCCSICGHTMGSTFGYKFCPSCGAKMEETNGN